MGGSLDSKLIFYFCFNTIHADRTAETDADTIATALNRNPTAIPTTPSANVLNVSASSEPNAIDMLLMLLLFNYSENISEL